MRIYDSEHPELPPGHPYTMDEMWASFKKHIDETGGWEKFNEESRSYERNLHSFLARQAELVRLFPDQWVAWADCEVVATAACLDDVRNETAIIRGTTSAVIFERLDVNPPNYMF